MDNENHNDPEPTALQEAVLLRVYDLIDALTTLSYEGEDGHGTYYEAAHNLLYLLEMMVAAMTGDLVPTDAISDRAERSSRHEREQWRAWEARVEQETGARRLAPAAAPAAVAADPPQVVKYCEWL